nr:LysR family transcriptional regulator [Streptomyces canus]
MEATALRQLTAYTAVALAASFTTAAAEMHVSQSSLSRAVADASSSACRLADRRCTVILVSPASSAI